MILFLSVKFHPLVKGNNAFEATVDGIEFASKNRFVSVFVLSVQVCISDLGLHCPPTPPISMLGNGVGRLRTRFHYTRPRLSRSAPFFSTLKLGVRGDVMHPLQKRIWFHLRTRFHLLSGTWHNCNKKHMTFTSAAGAAQVYPNIQSRQRIKNMIFIPPNIEIGAGGRIHSWEE